MRAVPRLGELYSGICLTSEEKARKNLSQGCRTIIGFQILVPLVVIVVVVVRFCSSAADDDNDDADDDFLLES